jgi:hypothetical protein
MNPMLSSYNFKFSQHKVTPEKMKQFLAEAGYVACMFVGVGASSISCLKAEKYAVELGDPQLWEDDSFYSVGIARELFND